MNAWAWADLQVGLHQEFEVRITQAMMASFREQTGDANPLHVDEAYARRAGFAGPVVYGLLAASFYSTLVGVYLPGKYALLQGLDVSFVHPVYVNDVLTVRGEVTYLNEAYRQAQLRGTMTCGKGRLVSRARILTGVLPPCRES